MQLENMMEMYQPRVSEQRQQTYFVVGDLESLSASALYGSDKYIKSTDAGDKEIPTFNYYNWATLKRFGETTLGIQQPGESHDAFRERMKGGAGIQIVPPAIKSGS